VKNNLQKLIIWIIKWPKSILFCNLLLVLLLSTGLPQLSVSNDFRVYFSEDNPQLKAFEHFEDNYVKSDSATLVISAIEGELFTNEGIKLIKALTAEAWQIPFAYRVSSLANYQYTRAADDEIITSDLFDISTNTEKSNQQLQRIRTIALSEKRLVNSLLTEDGKLSVIVANLGFRDKTRDHSQEITEYVEELRDRFRLQYPNFNIDSGGSTAFNTTLSRAVKQDMSTLIPLSYLLIFVGLFYFIRSFLAAAAIFLLISLCLVTTFGFFGWINPLLTPMACFAPSILLSIMVADSVHILITYLRQLQVGDSKPLAVQKSLQLNFMPVLVTSVTTMMGFLSLNFSTSPPYQDLGNMVAFGVLVAFVFSLLVLPALLQLLPFSAAKQRLKKGNNIFNILSIKMAEFVISNKRLLLIAVSSMAIILMAFIANNKMSDNWANYFDDSFPIIKLVNRIDGYLYGVNTLEYSLSPADGKTIFSPEYLQQMDDFEQWFRSQDKIFNVSSFSQLMKDLNKTMHNDEESWHRIPASSALAAQYLLFYEMGLPEGLGLNNLITIHQDASRFTVSMTNAGSEELLAMDQRAINYLLQHAPAIQPVSATGLGIVFAHIAQRNIRSLLIGTLIALFGISIVLLMVLKSVKLGLISLIPNIIPAAMAYGVWGMTLGFVDIALSIVACATLGIVVDDTVHFLHKYKLARQGGKNTEDAIREAFSRVGVALFTTSVVLAGGFMILAISHMNTSAYIGILMAITLIFALIVDFLLLPPLLLYLDKGSYLESKTLRRAR